MKKKLRGLNKAARTSIIIFCLFLAGAGQLMADTLNSGFETRISVAFENETLTHAIRKIERQSKVEFAYDPQFLGLQKLLVKEGSFTNERLDVVLKNLLKNTDIAFKEEIKGTITLYKKSGAAKAVYGKI